MRSRSRRKGCGIVQDILLEVNIGGEAAKSGFAPEDDGGCGGSVRMSWPHVRVRGLMTIPCRCERGPHGNLVYFEKSPCLIC
ncbi:MAG: hypothetical protein ACLU38_15870 [Dysosmobacter sp.]